MTDCFALLDEPRRPWLDPESLKQKFLALSSAVHPDRVHHLGESERSAAHQRYTELNAAYQRLREPRDRLRHLLDLEGGSTAHEQTRVPSDIAEIFFEIGQACRDADAHLTQQAKAGSPLLKAQLFARGQECAEKLFGLQQTVNARVQKMHEDLKALDARWPAAPPVPPALLDQLDDLYRRISFCTRWSAQMQERIVRLAV